MTQSPKHQQASQKGKLKPVPRTFHATNISAGLINIALPPPYPPYPLPPHSIRAATLQMYTEPLAVPGGRGKTP